MENLALKQNETKVRFNIANEDFDVIKESIESEKRELFKYAEKHSHNIERTEEIVRMQKRMVVLNKLLQEFRKKIQINRLEQIRHSALETFNMLHRKSGMVKELFIDSETLHVSIVDNKNREIDISRLSAGERQMLANSLLWAIAKSSGKNLPFVIDTPLGRLDSKHRDKLVKYFFPAASHQVLLLSTDQEITENEYKDLKSNIAREYAIYYSKIDQSSYMVEGYPFANTKLKEVVNV